jgi:hypothetical protein
MRSWKGPPRRSRKRKAPGRALRDQAEGSMRDIGLADASVCSVTPDFRQDRPLVDRFGHRHSVAALRNWSPAMQRVMALRPANDREDER